MSSVFYSGCLPIVWWPKHFFEHLFNICVLLPITAWAAQTVQTKLLAQIHLPESSEQAQNAVQCEKYQLGTIKYQLGTKTVVSSLLRASSSTDGCYNVINDEQKYSTSFLLYEVGVSVEPFDAFMLSFFMCALSVLAYFSSVSFDAGCRIFTPSVFSFRVFWFQGNVIDHYFSRTCCAFHHSNAHLFVSVKVYAVISFMPAESCKQERGKLCVRNGVRKERLFWSWTFPNRIVKCISNVPL